MIDCKQLMIHDYVSVGENFPSPAKVLEILYEGEECIFNLNGEPKTSIKKTCGQYLLQKSFLLVMASKYYIVIIKL